MNLSVLLLTLVIIKVPTHILSTDRLRARVPSSFLEPPPILRSYKLSSNFKLPPLIQRTTKQHQNIKLIQSIESWQSKQISSQNPPLTRDSAPYYDLKCNPCNRVPWIPIYGYVYPHQAIQHSHSVNVPVNQYYHPINFVLSNLEESASAVTPKFPLYMYSSGFQKYSKNHLWPSANVQNSILASEVPLMQEVVHEEPHTVFHSEPSILDKGHGIPQWINEPKLVPLFHYEHSTDYPAEFSHSPALTNLRHQFPQASNALSAYTTGLESYSTPSDTVLDISNHLEDNKYSSSEDDYTFSNNTGKVGKKLRSHRGENISTIMDVQTPPTVLFEHDWVTPNTDKEVIMKPLEDWAFIKEIEPKNEKRKKQIQIVIPYILNRTKHSPTILKNNSTKWYLNSTTTILPLINYLKGNTSGKKSNDLIDWQKLRKAIDSWTEERFSNRKHNSSIYFDIGLSTLSPSKEIPDDFLRNTLYYRENKEKYNQLQNRISPEIKGIGTSTEKSSNKWKSISANTKKKVFIVTPLPMTNYSFSSNGIDTENWTFL